MTAATDLYVRPVRRIAVRCRKNNGHWGYGVILSALTPQMVLQLTDQEPQSLQDPMALLGAYVYFYDQRGGGAETEIKGDKFGLGCTHRNKKRFPAQQMVIQLEALAHNTLIWMRQWLTPYCPQLSHWGMLRLVRDVCHMNGLILFDHAGHIFEIILHQAEPLARELSIGLAAILAREKIAVTLGEIYIVYKPPPYLVQ